MENEKKYELLLKEHDIITRHIHQQLSSNDKFVTFGLTFIAAGFFVAYRENITLMIHVMTIIFGGLILYGLYHYIFTFSNAGYLKRIEEEINLEVKRNFLIRTKIWDKTLINNFAIIMIYIVIGFIYVVMIYLSLSASIKELHFSLNNIWVLSLVYFVLIISIFISFNMIFRVYRKSYEIADKNFSDENIE